MARLRPAGAPNPGGSFEKWTVRLLLPALALALVIVPLNIVSPDRRDGLLGWRAWFDGPERGEWRALTIDGEDVYDARYIIEVRDGAVQGGHDACNSWNFSGESDPVTGERMMTSTQALCEDTSARLAYHALAFGTPRIKLQAGDRLLISQGRHRGTFRRWTKQDVEQEQKAARSAQGALGDGQSGETRTPAQPETTPSPPPPPLQTMPQPIPHGSPQPATR